MEWSVYIKEPYLTTKNIIRLYKILNVKDNRVLIITVNQLLFACKNFFKNSDRLVIVNISCCEPVLVICFITTLVLIRSSLENVLLQTSSFQVIGEIKLSGIKVGLWYNFSVHCSYAVLNLYFKSHFPT